MILVMVVIKQEIDNLNVGIESLIQKTSKKLMLSVKLMILKFYHLYFFINQILIAKK